MSNRFSIGRATGMLVVALSGMVLCACSGVTPADYASEAPRLRFNEFLQGTLTGWGIYAERGGKVSKRFRIDMTADWQGNAGRFTEHFSFNDGSTETREWQLTRLDEHHYTGMANDSVGTGHGEVWGNSMHWHYTIRTRTDSGSYDLDYDYWMYLVDEHTLINRATLSKFGYTLGDITVTFHKQ